MRLDLVSMCMFVLVHVQHAGSVFGRRPTGSLGESVLTPAPCDSVQEASGHGPSEPLSSKSNPDEGIDLHTDPVRLFQSAGS